MAGFNLIEALRVLTPRMVWRAVVYPYHAAYHIVRSTQPELRGLAFWQMVQRLSQATLPEPEHPPIEDLSFLGSVVSVEKNSDRSVTLYRTHGAMRILALADNLIQIRVREDGRFDPTFSYSTTRSETEWQRPEMTISETDSTVDMGLPSLRVHAGKQTGELIVENATGEILFREVTGGYGRHLASGEILWRASLPSDTALYGLGEKTSDLNQSGKRVELWNSDPSGYVRDLDPIYMSIPLLLGLSRGEGVGLFFDNSYRTWLDLGATTPGVVEYRAQDGEFRLYVMSGTPAQILETYTALTGRVSLPPLWAFGFQQARWSYYPDVRVLEVAKEFRKRQLPCDVIHLDIHYMDDYRCFTWNPRHFPTPSRMLDQLHGQGFKAVAIIDPGIKVDKSYSVCREGLARNAFVKYPDEAPFVGPVWPGDCYFPDFTDPAARSWWGELYRGLLEDGLDGFWNDMNEPALITQQSGATIPDVVLHSKEGIGGSHREVHNVYGMEMVHATTEGLRRLRPERRPMVITRSGWAGVQRYAMHWTGDNKSTWDHFRLSIQMLLTLGFSGIAITGPDIGGFTGTPTPELFARWFQTGVLFPFYRVHSMIHSPNQEPWEFGPEIEAISRRYLELRYQLLPYLYTSAWQASQNGTPIIRSLSFMHPKNTTTYSLDDQFFCGDSILAAPIVEEGATSRTVYLPEGNWVNFWTHEPVTGGDTLRVEAPLEVLPMFVRAGAAIPFWPIQQYVGEKPVEVLTLRVFGTSTQQASFLYEDDGLRPDYHLPEAHRVSRFVVEAEPDSSETKLTRKIESGTYDPAIFQIDVRFIGLRTTPANVDLQGGQLLETAIDPQTGEFIVRLKAKDSFQVTLR